MNTSSTSFKKAIHFAVNANKYLQENEGQTKFKYALEKVVNQFKSIGDDWSKKVDELDIEYAAEDKDGCVIYTERPNGTRKYSYSKDSIKKRDAAVEAAYVDENGISFESYYATSLPKELHPELIEIFKGFVIEPDQTVSIKES